MKNIVRKGEIACNKQILLFSQCFSQPYGPYCPFYMRLKMSSAICFNSDKSKALSSGNGLKKCIKPSFARACLIYTYVLTYYEYFSFFAGTLHIYMYTRYNNGTYLSTYVTCHGNFSWHDHRLILLDKFGFQRFQPFDYIYKSFTV